MPSLRSSNVGGVSTTPELLTASDVSIQRPSSVTGNLVDQTQTTGPYATNSPGSAGPQSPSGPTRSSVELAGTGTTASASAAQTSSELSLITEPNETQPPQPTGSQSSVDLVDSGLSISATEPQPIVGITRSTSTTSSSSRSSPAAPTPVPLFDLSAPVVPGDPFQIILTDYIKEGVDNITIATRPRVNWVFLNTTEPPNIYGQIPEDYLGAAVNVTATFYSSVANSTYMVTFVLDVFTSITAVTVYKSDRVFVDMVPFLWRPTDAVVSIETNPIASWLTLNLTDRSISGLVPSTSALNINVTLHAVTGLDDLADGTIARRLRVRDTATNYTALVLVAVLDRSNSSSTTLYSSSTSGAPLYSTALSGTATFDATSSGSAPSQSSTLSGPASSAPGQESSQRSVTSSSGQTVAQLSQRTEATSSSQPTGKPVSSATSSEAATSLVSASVSGPVLSQSTSSG